MLDLLCFKNMIFMIRCVYFGVIYDLCLSGISTLGVSLVFHFSDKVVGPFPFSRQPEAVAPFVSP